MANSTLRYNDTNKSLPYINLQRPLSASNRFDTRKSISFDPLERTTQRHESLYSRQAYADQTQLLDESRPFRHDVTKSDRLLAHSSGSSVQPYTFDASLKHMRPVPPSYPRNDYTSQVREMQLQLEQRDDRIWKLQVALDAMRETETQQLSTIQQLKRQLMFYETKDAVSNSSAVINNLQQEMRDSQQRVAELESRLRTHLEERERAEQDRASIEKTYMDAVITLSNMLFCDSSSNSLTFDEIINKVGEMVHDNSMMRGRQANVKELIGNLEIEQKTNRETITRLTSEIEKNQQIVSRSCIDVDNVRVERDAALSKQEELTKELETMKMRLEASHRAWSQMKAELEEARLNFSSSEAEKQRRTVADTLEGQRFTRFRENLASLLSDGTVALDPYEEQILSQVNKLVSAVAEKTNAMNALEKKLGDISSELERQFEVTKSERNKQKQLQGLVEELEEDLRRRGSKETVDQVLNNKDRFIKMLNKIASTLRMSPFKDSAPLEVVTNEIVSCVEDLINRFSNKSGSDDDDAEAMRVHIVNLQRKVKSLKEQLSMKDGQLDELSERMKEMEDKLSTLEIRDEDESTRVRKLSKILEKYKLELNEAHVEMRQLRARLLEAADLKSDSAAKEEEVKKLRSKLKHMEQEITKLKHEVSRLHHESQNMSQVTSELRSAKSALEEMTRQHKQLFELRQLLAGMLGIPYNTSVAVDFEMISRLEKLIVAIYRDPEIMENFHIDPNNSIGLAEEFKRGYTSVVDQTKTSGRSRQEKTLRSHNVNMRELNSRPRSLSPQKKLDTKVY